MVLRLNAMPFNEAIPHKVSKSPGVQPLVHLTAHDAGSVYFQLDLQLATNTCGSDLTFQDVSSKIEQSTQSSDPLNSGFCFFLATLADDEYLLHPLWRVVFDHQRTAGKAGKMSALPGDGRLAQVEFAVRTQRASA